MKIFYLLLGFILFSCQKNANTVDEQRSESNIIRKAELWGYNNDCVFENNSIENYPSFCFFTVIDTSFGHLEESFLILKNGNKYLLEPKSLTKRKYGQSLVLVTSDNNIFSTRNIDKEDIREHVANLMDSSYIKCVSNTNDTIILDNQYQLRFMDLLNLHIN